MTARGQSQYFGHPLIIYREGCPSSRDMGAICKHRKVSLLSRLHPNPNILRDASCQQCGGGFMGIIMMSSLTATSLNHLMEDAHCP